MVHRMYGRELIHSVIGLILPKFVGFDPEIVLISVMLFCEGFIN